MPIYLPIAETSINLLLLLFMGLGVGFLSGMFGVGGGFLMTPLLIFSGIPPAVAVGSEANTVVASSISGALAHWRRRAVDLRMAFILLLGGVSGSWAGVILFAQLRKLGQIDLLISLCYVLFLGVIGGLMLIESIKAWQKSRQGKAVSTRRPGQHNWIHGLPLKMRFKQSGLYISVIPPLLIGFLVGILAAIMGVGGGFIMVPAMIYILRMPTNVVIGTSLVQIVFVTASVTILHAVQNHTVDIVLAFILMLGAAFGAQIGARAGQKLRAEQLRALLALLVLCVGIKLLWGLVITPEEVFSTGSYYGAG